MTATDVLEDQKKTLNAEITDLSAYINQNNQSIELIRAEINRFAQEKQVEIDSLITQNKLAAQRQQRFQSDLADIDTSLGQLEIFPSVMEQLDALVAQAGVVSVLEPSAPTLSA